jgi:phosphatidylglycerophosphate synthase
MSTPTHTHPRARPRARRHLAVLARNLRTIPNQLTMLRLLMVPVLWGLAIMGKPVWVGVGVAIAATTDMLDGYLSRKWNQTSAFGSRMDSVADHLLAISTALWLALLRPHFFHEQKWTMIAWAAFALFVLAVSWLKFRRFVDLHLYTSKAAVILAFLFGIPLLVLGDYHPAHFYLTWGVCLLAAAEALWVILTRDRVDEHIGTVLVPRRRRS